MGQGLRVTTAAGDPLVWAGSEEASWVGGGRVSVGVEGVCGGCVRGEREGVWDRVDASSACACRRVLAVGGGECGGVVFICVCCEMRVGGMASVAVFWGGLRGCCQCSSVGFPMG